MDCSVTNTLPKPKTISVNGKVIPREVIAREVQNHPAEKPILAWQAAARALVVRELLLQESARLGIEAEPLRDAEGRSETDEEAAMRALIEREVVTPEPDEAACLRFYEQNRQRFRSGDLYEAAHILIASRPDDVAARTEARLTAENILAAVRSDPALVCRIRPQPFGLQDFGAGGRSARSVDARPDGRGVRGRAGADASRRIRHRRNPLWLPRHSARSACAGAGAAVRTRP